MPLYEYECESCGKRSEVIQKFSDVPRSVCADCGGPVRRLLSSPAVQFKGTGWYVTDYARKAAPDASGDAKGKESEKPTASSADAAKETKAAENAPTKATPATTD